jgi:23S rRNA pseudouridine2605 synthase
MQPKRKKNSASSGARPARRPRPTSAKPLRSKERTASHKVVHPTPKVDEPMRLNKYVAHCGICSRRQAVEHIKAGEVSVNGAVVIEPFYQVQPSDQVQFKGKNIRPEEHKVYILMNKPKDYITTLSDEKGRKTVISLLKDQVAERVFPVGRLDRLTTGLLLLTNDGDLAKKLSHPSHKVKKFYQVELNKPVDKADLERIRQGLELEDGRAEVDGVDYIEGGRRSEVGIRLHIGKNRIVRRIFERLGYEVKKLDRVYYAGLTKKDLPRGFWRHLTEQEVIMLKHFT